MQEKLLFVDDDFSIRQTLPAILSSHGFEVTVAENVPEAIARINQQQFDVLLADLHIGEPGDGFTVVSTMRRLQPHARTFILTGYPDFASALEAIRRQVDGYLIKPADVKTLLETVSAKEPNPLLPKGPGLRAAQVIRSNISSIADIWYQQISRDPNFAGVKLPKEECIDHLPEVLQGLAEHLDFPEQFSPARQLHGAAVHGRTRRKQGSTLTSIVTESRLLYRVIADTLRDHLLDMDISVIIPDLILISDTLNAMLSESISSFLSAEEIAA